MDARPQHPSERPGDAAAPRAPRRLGLFWLCVSVIAHAPLIAGLALQSDRALASDAEPPTQWIETVPPPQPSPPPPAEAPPPPPKPRTPKPRTPKPVVAPEPEPPQQPAASNADESPAPAGTDLVAESGAFEVNRGAGLGGSGTSVGTGRGTFPSSGDGSAEPRDRATPPAQLSLWMDTRALANMALPRAITALLMATPGFGELMRGAAIRPVIDLQRLRLRLSGVGADQLVVAGVHATGEQAVRDAAERVAAMRSQKPVWLGDSELRATAWIDGSGVDRGLAVHEGAFVIAARGAMPALLGASATGESVTRASRLRPRVLLVATVDDAARYLPALERCAPQSLRATVAASGGGYRLTLNTSYASARAAAEARACMQTLAARSTRPSRLLEWLNRAVGADDSTHFSTGVTNDDIEDLLDELAWSLRTVARAK